MELAPFWSGRQCRLRGCRGFIGPCPSTPLDARAYVCWSGQDTEAVNGNVKAPLQRTPATADSLVEADARGPAETLCRACRSPACGGLLARVSTSPSRPAPRR